MLSRVIDAALRNKQWTQEEEKQLLRLLNMVSILKRMPMFCVNATLLHISRRLHVPCISPRRIRFLVVDCLEISKSLYEMGMINKDIHEKVVLTSFSALFSSSVLPL